MKINEQLFELCNWLDERNDLETATASIAAEKIMIGFERPAEAS